MSEFVEPGDVMPAITLSDLDGTPISLEQYRGKKLLLFMWASW